MAEEPERARPRTSSRDPEDLRRHLADWLAATLPPGSDPAVPAVEIPTANGMSSETLLFDAAWREGGEPRAHALVARVAPDPASVPVFPTYDMHRQYLILQAVAANSAVPVPRTFWSEPDPRHLGAPFFVMEQVKGQVPPDVMPYNFGSWVTEATPEQRDTLQRTSVQTLADLHAIPEPEKVFAFIDDRPDGVGALRHHVTGQRAYYDWVAADGVRSPLIERGFTWLDEHWPAHEGPTVLSWGDARIGNMMFRDFTPVAVFDWEMTGLGPPEIDLGWFIFLHRFFEDITTKYGMPGMPDFLRRDDVAQAYETASGYVPRDLDFYTLYAALRHAVVMFRVQRRQIHFGEATQPDDPDDMIMHRASVEAMLDGTYWATLR